MSLPKQTSYKELIKKFKNLKWEGPLRKKDKRKGSSDHPFMKKGTRIVKIPNPHREDISIELLKKILYQAGISDEDWMNA